jgi:hypothetical protein
MATPPHCCRFSPHACALCVRLVPNHHIWITARHLPEFKAHDPVGTVHLTPGDTYFLCIYVAATCRLLHLPLCHSSSQQHPTSSSSLQTPCCCCCSSCCLLWPKRLLQATYCTPLPAAAKCPVSILALYSCAGNRAAATLSRQTVLRFQPQIHPAKTPASAAAAYETCAVPLVNPGSSYL